MIRVEDLWFRYHHQESPALNGISLEIPEGGVILVSGPTGCGKSTLGLALTGAIPQIIKGDLKGRISVGTLNPTVVSLRHMVRHIGLLLQNVESQMVTDRVEDEVAFGLENLAMAPREMPQRIFQALQKVRAEHLQNRGLVSLSAGERQRVMLAALLALGQQVLILDEPLAYLDRQAVSALMALVSHLGDAGHTCIILEHRRNLVLPVARTEIPLSQGKLALHPVQELDLSPLAVDSKRGEPALTFDRVTFGWNRSTTLFQDLSMEITTGQSLVVLGDNGAGKTSLLKLAMGILSPLSGRIWVENLARNALTFKKSAQNTALVLQNPAHQLRLPTVQQEVTWATASPELAVREIEALGLRGLEERHPHSLSSGQKRRVTLAAALARRPRLLLLDEPTVGQDDANLKIVLSRLGDFVQEGGALVTATHDFRAAHFLGQIILLIEQGRSVQGSRDLTADYFQTPVTNRLS